MSGMDFFFKIIVDSILTPLFIRHKSSDLRIKNINTTDCIKTSGQDVFITWIMKLNEILQTDNLQIAGSQVA